MDVAEAVSADIPHHVRLGRAGRDREPVNPADRPRPGGRTNVERPGHGGVRPDVGVCLAYSVGEFDGAAEAEAAPLLPPVGQRVDVGGDRRYARVGGRGVVRDAGLRRAGVTRGIVAVGPCRARALRARRAAKRNRRAAVGDAGLRQHESVSPRTEYPFRADGGLALRIGRVASQPVHVAEPWVPLEHVYEHLPPVGLGGRGVSVHVPRPTPAGLPAPDAIDAPCPAEPERLAVPVAVAVHQR